MLTGLWHGAAWNFVLWGLLYAAFLLLERFVPAIQKLPTAFRRVYVLLVVVLGFVLFNAESLSQAAGDIAGMFGFGGVPLISSQTVYYLRSYGVLLAAAVIGSTPLIRNIGLRLSEKPAGAVLECVLLILLLLVCSAYLVDGSFNPFLYFRF
jgi:alginate O-acetyltransferase complex protein AlgI